MRLAETVRNMRHIAHEQNNAYLHTAEKAQIDGAAAALQARKGFVADARMLAVDAWSAARRARAYHLSALAISFASDALAQDHDPERARELATLAARMARRI